VGPFNLRQRGKEGFLTRGGASQLACDLRHVHLVVLHGGLDLAGLGGVGGGVEQLGEALCQLLQLSDDVPALYTQGAAFLQEDVSRFDPI